MYNKQLWNHAKQEKNVHLPNTKCLNVYQYTHSSNSLFPIDCVYPTDLFPLHVYILKLIWDIYIYFA